MRLDLGTSTRNPSAVLGGLDRTEHGSESLSKAPPFGPHPMKTPLSSFDLRALVAEWQELVGGYLDKAFAREDEVILRLHVPDRGRRELYSKAGRWLCLHEVEDRPETPPPFAQTLRRLLDNARVTAVEQRGFDRIVLFRVEKGGDAYEIVFEVFGKGNLVVVKGGMTVAASSHATFRDRTVRPGEPYAFPPQGMDPLEADRNAFRGAIREAKGQGAGGRAGEAARRRPEGREGDRRRPRGARAVRGGRGAALPDVQRGPLPFPPDRAAPGTRGERGRGEVRAEDPPAG